MNILVLDDDICVLNVVKVMLRTHGHQVDCADKAVEAIQKLKAKAYDIVLFDYIMPQGNGLWFLENAGLSPRIFAVLMTGYGTPDLINRALELGASGYILKPFTMDELMQHIEFYSKQKESGQFVRHEALMLSTAQ